MFPMSDGSAINHFVLESDFPLGLFTFAYNTKWFLLKPVIVQPVGPVGAAPGYQGMFGSCQGMSYQILATTG